MTEYQNVEEFLDAYDRLSPKDKQRVDSILDKSTDDSPLKRKPPVIEFRLTMPSVRSWNGKWSGEGSNYVIYKPATLKTIERLGISKNGKIDDIITASWDHRFSDGWVARVTPRLLRRGEKKQKSDGFCGYNWMVDSILTWGDIRVREKECE